MDPYTLSATHLRRLRSAIRKTGTTQVTLKAADGVLTFVGTAANGDRKVSGKIAADGTVTLAAPKAKKAEPKA